jgi:hypothetical protein
MDQAEIQCERKFLCGAVVETGLSPNLDLFVVVVVVSLFLLALRSSSSY